MKTIKKFNILDIAISFTLIISISGYLFARAEKSPLNKIIEGKEKIHIEILIPDVFTASRDHGYFKVGEETAVTIRNKPYTRLSIIKVESKPKQVIIPAYNGSHKVIDDPTKPNVKDYFVTLSDTVFKTKDGYVSGGNKIKTGNQIELEGFNYRLSGKIIDISSVLGSK